MNKNLKKVIIRVLEDISEGKVLKNDRYSISEESFNSVVDYITYKDLARGMNIVKSRAVNNERIPGFMNPYITSRGVDYLNKNL